MSRPVEQPASPAAEVTAWHPDRRALGWPDLVAVLVWSAAVAFFFWDAVSFRKALFYFDITEINYPYRDFLAKEMRLGRFSRWMPGLYHGMPLYSESQAGYLHPLKYLLYPWLDTWKAFNLDTVLSVWLTGLGTFGWLRRHVGPLGALTGASVFGLGGFVWAHLIHTSMVNALASIPVVIWATEWAWDRGRLAGVVVAAFALACQVFAGHLQDALFMGLLVGLYGLFRAATECNLRGRVRVLGTACAVVGLGVALSAVQWIPSKELLDRSPRAGGLSWRDLTYGSWGLDLLPTLVVREAYGTRARDTDWMDGFYPYHEMNAYLGLTAMGLAVAGAAASRDRWVAFWIVLAGVGSVLMLGRFTFLFDHANKIPLLGSSRIPVRFHVWVSLAVAALAGVGVDRLERGFPIRLRWPALFVTLLVLGSVPILVYVYQPAFSNPGRWNRPYHLARYRWLGQELSRALVRTAIAGGVGAAAVLTAARTRSAGLRRVACSVLPVVVIADLLGSHWVDVPMIDPSYWTKPPLSARVLKADPTFTRLAFVRTYRGEPSAGEPGYASLPIDFMAVRDTLGWSLPPVWGLASAAGETPLLSRRLVESTDEVRAGLASYDVAAVSHLLTSRRNGLDLGAPREAGTALIYRSPGALPRVRLAGRPEYAASEAGAVAAMNRLGPLIRERLVVEDPTRPLPEGSDVSGTARIVAEVPDRVVVDVKAFTPAFLILADTYDPGWSAESSGKVLPIRPAWLTFRAVYVPAGRHRVVFRYKPAGFGLGLGLTIAGLAASAVLLARPRRTEGTSPPHAPLGGSPRWPGWGVLALAALVGISAVKIDRGGKVRLSERWKGGIHQFTWGAGIEAIRPRSPK